MNDDLLYTRIASNFFNRPLALRLREAEIIGHFLRSRMEGAGPDANRFAGEEQRDGRLNSKGYRVAGNAGVITIVGELVNRGAWLGASSGLTSYEGIVQQVKAAAADDKVKSIVLDIQSPGGEAVGMNETARFIRQVSKSKPVVAVVNGMAASAAYGLASGAGEIVVTESAITGSIGVVLVHFDQSKRLEAAGVKATVIHAGNLKAVGNQFSPLSDDDRAVLQGEVDRFMTGFVDLVAGHRGIAAEKVRGFEAGIFIGGDAVKAGLADRVGTFESVVDELAAGVAIGKRITTRAALGPAAAASYDVAYAEGLERGRAIGTAEVNDRVTAVRRHPAIAGDAGRLEWALKMALAEPDVSVEDIAARFPRQDAAPAIPKVALANRDQLPDTLAQAAAQRGKADEVDALGAFVWVEGSEFPSRERASFDNATAADVYAARRAATNIAITK